MTAARISASEEGNAEARALTESDGGAVHHTRVQLWKPAGIKRGILEQRTRMKPSAYRYSTNHDTTSFIMTILTY